MSGGHFEYKQHVINEIRESIVEEIMTNDHEYSEETIIEFENAVTHLARAYIYAQRIDWLLSGDDDEETFHERLKEDLEAIK